MVALPVHDVAPLSKPELASSWPGEAQLPPPPPPVEPWASHAVAFRPRAALSAVGSVQPLYRVLPDSPVPSSMVELSPQIATRPLPNVLVTKNALLLPGVEVLRYTRPLTLGLSAGLRVKVVPLAIRLCLTLPKEPFSTALDESVIATGWSELMFFRSTEKPNGSVLSTPLLVMMSLMIFGESQPS